jgi:L-lactate dehydrogenase complex protein LldG
MSEARTAILQRIRGALGRNALGENARRGLEARSAAHTVHIKPAIPADTVERFKFKLQAVAATLAEVASSAEAVDALRRYLDEHGLPHRAVAASDPYLRALPWPDDIALEHRPARGEDQVSITAAFAAVAETGSVVLLSDPESPTTLNFLPDAHIVVLDRARIVPHIEDVWERLRLERGAMPRTVNFITGPSRTADIEQTIQLGAHGPRRLHVIVVQENRRRSV